MRNGFAAYALRELGVTHERVLQRFGQARAGQAHEQRLELDAPARRTLVDAVDEARQLKHDYIGTEHILLGLTCEQASALERAGTTANEVRAQVLRMLAQP